MNRIRCLCPVTHHVGDRTVNGVSQAGLVGAFRVICRSFTRVDWLARLARIFWSNGDRAMAQVNRVGLICRIVIVKDDFSAVGIVTYQSVAKTSVGVDCGLGGVAALGVRYAVQIVDLQGLPSLVVNVSYASLLLVGSVDNYSIFTWIIWNEAIWTYRYTFNLWCISFVLRNNNLSSFSRVIRVIRILGWCVSHEWIIILINKDSIT